MRIAKTAAGWNVLLGKTHHVRRLLVEYGWQSNEAPRAMVANSSRLTSIVGDGWLAAGDSAFSYDPLSSQGILAALTAGRAAAHAALKTLQGGREEPQLYERKSITEYAVYQRLLKTVYTAEQRWPRAAFWKRRHDMHTGANSS